MANEKDKRRLLGIDDGEALPTFGKRVAGPPESVDEQSDHDLTEFRNEARSLLQQGRERADAKWAEAKAAARKTSILNLIRRKKDVEEPEAAHELSEEEEWKRRMSENDRPDDVAD